MVTGSRLKTTLSRAARERVVNDPNPGDHQETVTATLSEILAGRQQTTELARLREHVGRIALIAGQALQGRDSSLI
ncbi:hypothetical protein [Streptomyces lavendulae]|uniref:hypothetical protein n=1 Tax=Streptomyces lavendulae TaxID=1914 RepID=UPI0024A2E17C|nr:hypothetical protein [Streptomyces lavendulae]GLW02009.1 hypothetical protein Slala05_56400 [Streptomyces lavendulae subsp. lavendulae]